MEKGDFFLCVSYSGKSIPSAAQLLQMKRRNVRTVLITAAKDVTGFQMVLTFPDR